MQQLCRNLTLARKEPSTTAKLTAVPGDIPGMPGGKVGKREKRISPLFRRGGKAGLARLISWCCKKRRERKEEPLLHFLRPVVVAPPFTCVPYAKRASFVSGGVRHRREGRGKGEHLRGPSRLRSWGRKREEKSPLVVSKWGNRSSRVLSRHARQGGEREKNFFSTLSPTLPKLRVGRGRGGEHACSEKVEEKSELT